MTSFNTCWPGRFSSSGKIMATLNCHHRGTFTLHAGARGGQHAHTPRSLQRSTQHSEGKPHAAGKSASGQVRESRTSVVSPTRPGRARVGRLCPPLAGSKPHADTGGGVGGQVTVDHRLRGHGVITFQAGENAVSPIPHLGCGATTPTIAMLVVPQLQRRCDVLPPRPLQPPRP